MLRPRGRCPWEGGHAARSTRPCRVGSSALRFPVRAPGGEVWSTWKAVGLGQPGGGWGTGSSVILRSRGPALYPCSAAAWNQVSAGRAPLPAGARGCLASGAFPASRGPQDWGLSASGIGGLPTSSQHPGTSGEASDLVPATSAPSGGPRRTRLSQGCAAGPRKPPPHRARLQTAPSALPVQLVRVEVGVPPRWVGTGETRPRGLPGEGQARGL